MLTDITDTTNEHDASRNEDTARDRDESDENNFLPIKTHCIYILHFVIIFIAHIFLCDQYTVQLKIHKAREIDMCIKIL